ncbi:MAG TPA: FHA domain-containing serine/threonine-protein kinase [Armatimonadota bacterium]|nr:FHA domain-containing serine/threonine-protein kinase [Armatimonadota bacterium]
MSILFDIIAGPHAGERYLFTEPENFWIGRSAHARYPIGADDPQCSTQHLMVEMDPPRCRIRNISQTNGTLVNGVPIEVADLAPGDTVCMGETVFRVARPDDQAGMDTPTEPLTQASPPGMPDARTELLPPAPYDHARLYLAGRNQCLRCDARRPATAETPRESYLCADCAAAMTRNTETVPGYRCLSRLHEGKLCTVWLAEDARTRERAAVKLFTPPDNVSGQAEIIFRRECAISLDLRHPHIVRFFRAGDYRGRLYIAMEYVAGRDALDLLHCTGCTLSPRVVTAIARQTLEALDHAHRRFIVHRDIKPSNLLLDGEAPDYHVKVTDFGIARVYRAARLSRITCINDVRGTPWFMPPEQAVNCRGVDHRADLFSLGATMYHLLTGRFVYDIPPGTPEERLLTYVQPSLVVPITARGVSLPRPLASFVMRAVDADPNRRFQSAREMRDALDALPL